MKLFFDRLFVFMETLAAGVWVGALAGFGFAVAGTVFQELPTINLAGNVNAAVLAKLNRLEFIAAAGMAGSAVYFFAAFGLVDGRALGEDRARGGHGCHADLFTPWSWATGWNICGS